jgi:ribosomal protein S18 acetylase RimI-like enzyme
MPDLMAATTVPSCAYKKTIFLMLVKGIFMSITYRTFRKSDIPAIVAISNVIAEQQNDPGRTTEERLHHLISMPHINAEEDFFVALNSDNQIIGGTLMMLRPDTTMFFADVTLHPDYQEKQVVIELVQRSEARAIERVELVQRSEARAIERAEKEWAGDTAVSMIFGVDDYKTYISSALFEIGYSEIRRQYEMRITLDKPLDKPDFPPEYEFRPFEIERDARVVHAVFQECFADHFGGVAQIPYDQWAHQFEDTAFDPTLFYILYYGDDIAAICLCEISPREEKLGIVEVLGVRPPFRKHGLGRLLLRHAFYEFQQRAYREVGLDVDTENTTNAVALYKNAGMNTHRCTIGYHRVLRGSI